MKVTYRDHPEQQYETSKKKSTFYKHCMYSVICTQFSPALTLVVFQSSQILFFFCLFVLFQLPIPIWQVFPVSLGHSR